MPKKSATLKKEQAYHEAFLARLGQKLAAPTSEWPTVRCWAEPKLEGIFTQTRDELAGEGTEARLTHRSLLEWLHRLGLVTSLPVEGESTYFLIEIGANAKAEVDPLELLM